MIATHTRATERSESGRLGELYERHAAEPGGWRAGIAQDGHWKYFIAGGLTPASLRRHPRRLSRLAGPGMKAGRGREER